jgi:phosphate transport system permease protein
MLNSINEPEDIDNKKAFPKASPVVYKSWSNKSKHKWLPKRQRKEKLFRMKGLLAILISSLFLGGLFWSIVSKGYQAFVKTNVLLPIEFSADVISEDGSGDYMKLIRNALQDMFPEATSRSQKPPV